MGSPVVSSVPNSQTWLGLLAAEPIETELSAGIGLGEVVHDEPFQLASSTAWVRGLCTLKIQTSESVLVLPGIMVMTVVFASIGTGIGLNTDVTKGIFDRFRSLPISRSAPLTGTIMGDFVRYLVSIAMVFAYGSLLGFRIATNPMSALGAAGLMFVFGFAVGWIWVLLGLYVKSPQSLQGFGFIVMFPLAFGSNVFIQTSTLPGWLQAWVRVNPVTALAGASRGLMLGGPVATPAWHSIAWSIVITVVFAPLAVRRYRHIG